MHILHIVDPRPVSGIAQFLVELGTEILSDHQHTLCVVSPAGPDRDAYMRYAQAAGAKVVTRPCPADLSVSYDVDGGDLRYGYATGDTWRTVPPTINVRRLWQTPQPVLDNAPLSVLTTPHSDPVILDWLRLKKPPPGVIHICTGVMGAAVSREIKCSARAPGFLRHQSLIVVGGCPTHLTYHRAELEARAMGMPILARLCEANCDRPDELTATLERADRDRAWLRQLGINTKLTARSHDHMYSAAAWETFMVGNLNESHHPSRTRPSPRAGREAHQGRMVLV